MYHCINNVMTKFVVSKHLIRKVIEYSDRIQGYTVYNELKKDFENVHQNTKIKL